MTTPAKQIAAAFRVKVALDFIKSSDARCRQCAGSVNQHRGADHCFDPLRPLDDWTPEAASIARIILAVEASEARRGKKYISANQTVAPQELPR